MEDLSARFPELDPNSMHTYLTLEQVFAELTAARDAHFTRQGLGDGRFRTLILLYTALEPLSPAYLAEKTGVTRATMSGLLDTLQQAELIRREPSARDRRAVEVHLTETGRARLEAMLPDHFRRMAGVMQGLTREDHDTLVQLLAKIQAGIPFLRDP